MAIEVNECCDCGNVEPLPARHCDRCDRRIRDRLAAIERQVRELADRIESGAEPVLEDTECIVDELRAILDPPDGEGS